MNEVNIREEPFKGNRLTWNLQLVEASTERNLSCKSIANSGRRVVMTSDGTKEKSACMILKKN